MGLKPSDSEDIRGLANKTRISEKGLSQYSATNGSCEWVVQGIRRRLMYFQVGLCGMHQGCAECTRVCTKTQVGGVRGT